MTGNYPDLQYIETLTENTSPREKYNGFSPWNVLASWVKENPKLAPLFQTENPKFYLGKYIILIHREKGWGIYAEVWPDWNSNERKYSDTLLTHIFAGYTVFVGTTPNYRDCTNIWRSDMPQYFGAGFKTDFLTEQKEVKEAIYPQ